jgi:DedD protein
MTENISEEELSLRKRARRRLVGAIALVITAIIILPMIFDEEPEMTQHEIDIRLPTEELVTEHAPSMQTQDRLPFEDMADEVDEKVGALEPLPFESVESSQMDVEPFEKQMNKNYIPVPAVKPKRDMVGKRTEPIRLNETPARDVKEFVVQLGAFSDHSKARQQQQNLVSHGINAYTETLMTNNKEMMRVRIGPFTTRSDAEQELVKLRKLGLDGVITAK